MHGGELEMSLHRDHGEISFECDYCGTVEETGTSDFGEAIRNIKEAEWVIRKVGREWKHFCSEECAGDR